MKVSRLGMKNKGSKNDIKNRIRHAQGRKGFKGLIIVFVFLKREFKGMSFLWDFSETTFLSYLSLFHK